MNNATAKLIPLGLAELLGHKGTIVQVDPIGLEGIKTVMEATPAVGDMYVADHDGGKGLVHYLISANGVGMKPLAAEMRRLRTTMMFLVRTSFERYLGPRFVVAFAKQAPFATGFHQYRVHPTEDPLQPIGFSKAVYKNGSLLMDGKQPRLFAIDTEDWEKIKADEGLAAKAKAAYEQVFNELSAHPYVYVTKEATIAVGTFTHKGGRYALILTSPRKGQDSMQLVAMGFTDKLEKGMYAKKTANNPMIFLSPAAAALKLKGIPEAGECYKLLGPAIDQRRKEMIQRARERREEANKADKK